MVSIVIEATCIIIAGSTGVYILTNVWNTIQIICRTIVSGKRLTESTDSLSTIHEEDHEEGVYYRSDSSEDILPPRYTYD